MKNYEKEGEVDVAGSFVRHVNREEAELADAWLSQPWR
jgi:hypothetical protein